MKTCETCAEPIPIRARDSAAQRARRRHCSEECRRGWSRTVARVIAGDSRITSNGYRQLYLPMHPAAKRAAYVYEHRLVMERTLGRFLAPHEHVHHADEDTLDNRAENLEVVTGSQHRIIHFRVRRGLAEAA